MVLVKASLSLIVVIGFFLLSACSGYSIKPVPVSKPGIIPAQSTPSKPASPLPLSISGEAGDAKTETIKEIEKPHFIEKKATKLELKTPSPTISIIEVLIAKAQKAIDLQQWLRAQRSLEQAIRISPSEAQVFFLYGIIYEGLSIPKQAEQMYRRAIFLAGENTSIAQQAKENLTKLPLSEKMQ